MDKAGRPATDRSPPSSHDQLIASVRAGDVAAFEQLYRIFQPRLARFVGTLVRRPHLVEDIVNETLLVVWNRPDSFHGTSSLGSWIFGIGYRQSLKALRRFDEPVEDAVPESLVDPADGPEPALDQARLGRELAGCIAGLSANHRAVIDLCYFHEMDLRSIAEIMDCPVDTVKTRLFHARRRLRHALGGTAADWI